MKFEGALAAVGDKAELSSPDRIYRTILEGLYLGRYVHGQRLIEADLTREFKVARGPVREALSRLAAEGVVSLHLNRGAQIRSLTRAEARDILAVSETLVVLAAKLAAESMRSASNRKMLRAALDRLLEFPDTGDFFGFVRARNAFYRALVQIGGNGELARVLPSIQVHLVRTQFRSYLHESAKDRLDDYRRIGEAVLQGSSQKAETAVRRHIRAILAAIERLPEEAFAVER